MPDRERISRLDIEERWFSGTLVSVSTHRGTITVSGRLLDNFNLDLAVEWVCYVLNGWDLPADRDKARQAIARSNRENQK